MIFADEQIQRTNHSTAGPVVQYATVSFDLPYLDYRLACSKNIQKFSKPTIKQTHVFVEKRMVKAKSISASGLLLPPTGPTAVAALLRGCCHHLVRYLVKFHNLYFGYIRCFVPSPSISNHCMPYDPRILGAQGAQASCSCKRLGWRKWRINLISLSLGKTSRKIKKGARKPGRIRELATELGIQLVYYVICIIIIIMITRYH